MQNIPRDKRRAQGKRFFVLGFFIALVALLPLVSFAQLNLNTVPASTFGLGSADLLSTVIRVVQWALGLLGLVAVIIMMYGGFLWMTARGNVDQVQKAKRVLIQASIGLVIILLAWAIVYFIVQALTNVTTAGPGGPCTVGTTQDWPVCQICNAGGTWDPWNPGPPSLCNGPQPPNYYVRWDLPDDGATNVPLCSVVGAGFDGVTPPWVNGGTVDNVSVEVRDSSGTNVALNPGFTTPANSNFFEYKHDVEWLPNETYTVEINPLASATKLRSQTGVDADNYDWEFTTGVISDEDPPIVSTWGPQGNQVCLTPQIWVTFNEPMAPSSMVASNVTFNPPDATIVGIFASGSNGFTATLSNPLQANTTYTITLNADTTTGFRDACYNALDCQDNVTPTAPQDGVCNPDGNEDGSPLDDFFWTFTTDDTTETDCKPEITGVTPTGPYSNAAGDVITVTGKNLGGIVDTLFFSNKFWGTQIGATDVVGINSQCFNADAKPNTGAPDPDSVACIQSWGDTEITAIVPPGTLGQVGSGATGGNMTVRSGGGQLSDPNSSFLDVTSPHIRGISPAQGGEGQYVTIFGENFGASGRVVLRRDDGYEVDAQTCATDSWSDGQIVIKIPTGSNFNVGDNIRVQVDTDLGSQANANDRSNLYTFLLNADPPTPGICTIAPNCHNGPSQNITLTGEFFGAAPGSGRYAATGSNAPNIYNGITLPADWDEDEIIMTSPATLPNDTFLVSVTDLAGRSSNYVNYKVPCAAAPQVVFDATCNPGAGTFPSPNPYPDTQEICTNLSSVAVRFTEDMALADIAFNSGNIDVFECTGDKSGCTIDIGPVGHAIPAPQVSARYLLPGAGLTPNRWHQFIIRGDVRSDSGVRIGNDVVWYFKTKADPTPCEADTVNLSVTQVFGPAIYNEPYSGHPNSLEYTADPITNSCQILFPPAGGVSWDVTDTSVAECQGGACGNAVTQNVDTLLQDGTTFIQADIGSVSAQKQLTVQLNYCQTGADCTCNGNPGVCNTTLNRCEPYVESVSPPGPAGSGPKDTLTTIQGCFFGNQPGKAEFIRDFGLPGEERKEGVQLCTIPTWTNTTVITGSPDYPLGTATDVNIASLYFDAAGLPQYLDSAHMGFFNYADTCGGLTPPGLCSIFPTASGEGTNVTLSGLNLPNGANVNDDVVFNVGQSSPTVDWTGSPDELIAEVPQNAITGNVYVFNGAGACQSNAITFTVSCAGPGNCGSGCCQANSCVDAVLCQPITAGTQCNIPGHPDLSCQTGFSVDPTGTWTCIADQGFTSAKNPPPPPLGGDCQFCCDPDPNNDGNYADAQVNLAGLACTPIPFNATPDPTCRSAGVVPGTEDQQRGLFCGCTSDIQCGIGTGCALQNDPQSCCRPAPFFTPPTNPAPGNISCTNQAFRFNFNTGGTSMDYASMTSANITATDGGGNPIPGNIFPDASGFTFEPTAPFLTPGSSITIDVTTDVQNAYGINITNPVSFTWNLAAGATLCSVDHVDVEWFDGGAWSSAPYLIRCALNGCVSDMFLAKIPGAQQLWRGRALDAQNRPIAGTVYHWDDSQSNGIFSVAWDDIVPYNNPCPNDQNTFGCLTEAAGQNGYGVFTVKGDAGAQGDATGTGYIYSYLCEKPWPDPVTAAAPYNVFPFRDPDDRFHFSMHYCRDSGLPEMRLGVVNNPNVNSPLQINGTVFNPGVDDRLREYLFVMTDDAGNRIGNDAIGLIIMENELHLPPDLWYKRLLPQEPQEGSLIEVNGFPAWRVGRSVYIAGTNIDTAAAGANVCAGPGSKCDNAVMYSNMYIFSYSDNASGQTQGVFNEILNNFRLNTQTFLDDNERTQLRRDVKRVHSFARLGLALSDYKKQHGDYPELNAGSFIEDISTSVWPSWSQTLGARLGSNLPVDPVNTTQNCAATADPATCWDEPAREYQIGNPSNIFQYNYYQNSGEVNLFARFEYLDAGSWRKVPNDPDTLSGICNPAENGQWASASCDGNFNYLFNSLEFETLVTAYQTMGASDTDAPENLTLTGFNPPIDGPRAIDATATDDRPTDSGMARVEFYYRDAGGPTWTLDATDFNEADGWKWNFEPTATPAGAYDFRMLAFDNAGNVAEFIVPNVAVSPSLADLIAPSISGFAAGPVTTTQANQASIAAPGQTSMGIGSVLYVNYWGNPATVSRCNDFLTGCNTIITAPNNPIPPQNDTPDRDYHHLGEDRARPTDFLVTYTPYDVGAYPPRKVQRYLKTMGAGGAPTAEYSMYNVTHASGRSDGMLVTVISANTVRVFDPINAVYNPAAGQNTQIASRGFAGIQGLENDSYGNTYITQSSGVITKLDTNLNTVGSFAGLNNPYGVYAASDRVYVAELGAGRVVALNTNLTAIIETYSGFTNPIDVIEKNGDVYVLHNNLLAKFTPIREATGTITFTVDASDNVGVTKVEYYLNTSFIASVNTGNPYSYAWDSTSVPDGTYTLYAVAFDAAGNTTVTRQTVKTVNGLDNVAPSVFISTPHNGDTVSSVINVTAVASDNQGVANVRLQINGVDFATDTTSPYTWQWNTSQDANGNAIANGAMIQLTAIATDINGNTNSNIITVRVDNGAGGVPSAWFIDPEDGDIFAPGVFEAYATDPDGTVDHVEMYNAATGVLIDSENVPFNSIYDLNWNPALPDGDYQLYVVAVDNSGQVSSPTAPGATVNVKIDTVPPTISSFSPPDNTTLTGTEAFSATATDLNGIDKIEIYAIDALNWGNYTMIGSCNPATPQFNYTCNINYDTALLTDGEYVGSAVAYDMAGLTTSSTRWGWIFDNGTTPPSEPVIPSPIELVAGASDIYKVAVGSSSWSNVNGLQAGQEIRSIREYNGFLYATATGPNGSGLGQVYRSSDAGATWTAISIPGLDGVYDIVQVGTTLYAGGYPNRTVYASVDQGSTWILVGSVPSAGLSVYSVENVGGTLYVGMEGSIYSWNGSAWVNMNLPAGSNVVNDMVVFGGNLYATASNQIYSQPVGGGAWTARGTIGGAANIIYTFVESGGQLYAGNSASGVYQFNGSNVWTLRGTLNNGVGTVFRLLDVGGTLYVGHTNAVYSSTDQGASWSQIGTLTGAVIGLIAPTPAAPAETDPPSDPVITLSPEYVATGTHYSTTNTNAFNTTGQVFIQAVTNDQGSPPSGLAYIDIRVDGVLIDPNGDGFTCVGAEITGGNTCRVQWNGPTAGAHSVSAIAEDNNANLSNSISIPANIDNAPPTGQITTPGANWIVTGSQLVSTNVADAASGVGQVEFFADGLSYFTDTAAAWFALWDSTTVPDGNHTLSMQMRDNVGNQSNGASDPVPVVVNQTPGGTICGPLICIAPTSSCCGNTACYNPTTQACCSGAIYNRATQQCCNGVIQPIGTICNIRSGER